MQVWERIVELQRGGVDLVVVTIGAVRGSVPGEVGGKAVVTADGLALGTLGGGKVEAKAIREAQAMLEGEEGCKAFTWNLQKDVGMTCGGEMSFVFERVGPGSEWHLVVFGAGHVAQALVPLLATLRCRVDVVDERSEWLERLPEAANVTRRKVERYVEGVELVTAKSFVVSVTKGHAADRPVLKAVLSRYPEIPFVGVIGSAAKRAVLLRELKEDGLSEELVETIVCPLGLPIGGNDPAEIAISIAGQLLERRG